MLKYCSHECINAALQHLHLKFKIWQSAVFFNPSSKGWSAVVLGCSCWDRGGIQSLSGGPRGQVSPVASTTPAGTSVKARGLREQTWVQCWENANRGGSKRLAVLSAPVQLIFRPRDSRLLALPIVPRCPAWRSMCLKTDLFPSSKRGSLSFGAPLSDRAIPVASFCPEAVSVFCSQSPGSRPSLIGSS